MPRINLLPWRESERKRKRQEFFLSLGAGVATAALVALARPVADECVDQAPGRPQFPADDGNRRAGQADRGNQRPRRAEAAAARAHGNHRDAAAQPSRDRARVRRDRAHPAGGRLPHVPEADRHAVRAARHRAVEHARVHVHAQHRCLGVAGRSRHCRSCRRAARTRRRVAPNSRCFAKQRSQATPEDGGESAAQVAAK